MVLALIVVLVALAVAGWATAWRLYGKLWQAQDDAGYWREFADRRQQDSEQLRVMLARARMELGAIPSDLKCNQARWRV